MELSKIQQEIVESPYAKIVIIASAACGKTKTLTERVRFWLRSGVPAAEPSCLYHVTVFFALSLIVKNDKIFMRWNHEVQGMYDRTIDAETGSFSEVGRNDSFCRCWIGFS